MLKIVMSAVLILSQVAVPVSSVFAQTAQGQAQEAKFEQLSPTAASAAPSADSSAASAGLQAELKASPFDAAEYRDPMKARVDIRVTNAPLYSFLDGLSAQAKKITFFVAPDVANEPITAYIRNFPIQQILQMLLDTRGIVTRRLAATNAYTVTKRSKTERQSISKIYKLNYIPLIPLGNISQEMSNIMPMDVSSSGSGSSSGGGYDMGGSMGGSSMGGASGMSAMADIAIIGVVKSILSDKGKVAVEPRTNSLIVTDLPEVIARVDDILLELDVKAPQVMIEAQIVEVNSDKVRELGIDWGGQKGEMAKVVFPQRVTDYLIRPGFFQGDSWKHFFQEGSVPTGGYLSLNSLTVVLRAMITSGDAKYLGKPKIVTVNNKTAMIMLSRDAAVAQKVVTQNAGGNNSINSTEVERRRVGLMLKVTPQVNKDGYITLLIQPSYSDIAASGITLEGQTVYDPLSRGLSTLARLKNGQTLVVGGLLSSSENKMIRKVPLLGSIPLIGWLFKSESSKKTNSELVIFITPTIMQD
ncbi:MAG: hypothetical protein NTW04_02750 [Elusimicrobia bacterium]|nr:hypothetical protein [Elusimicrobiota bacterium]